MSGEAERLRLGNYEPLLRLATGGMATVFAARRVGAAGFERLVVLKRVHPHLLVNSEFYDMFREEARVASLVHHPNVVPVVDVIEWQGELLLVMEYVDGTSMSTINKSLITTGQRMSPGQAARIVADILAGLGAAHEALDMRGQRLEIVHRDVSPQNIIVGQDGISRLIDFGIAKARHRITETRDGSLKGKVGYMSPEQTRGLPVDSRSDLFSAGVVLYEALTSTSLFHVGNDFESLIRIHESPIPNPSSVVPGIPRPLDAVVQKALSRDVTLRFQTAAEFQAALEAAISPSSYRDIASLVRTHCGPRLDERRAALQAMLEGRQQVTSSVESDERFLTPSALRRAPSVRFAPDTQISASHDAPVPQTSKTARVALVVGLVAVVMVAAFIGAKLAISPHTSSQLPSSTLSATTPTARPTSVSVTLISDAPIQRVIGAGIISTQSRGDRMVVELEPWVGTRSIEVVFPGDAKSQVQLDQGTSEQRVSPPASASASVSSPPSTRKPPAKPPSTSSELHESPY